MANKIHEEMFDILGHKGNQNDTEILSHPIQNGHYLEKKINKC
jgi:hypothetical protein